MKSSLLEHYKKKYGTGGKIPVRKTGMWYQEGDVVVPSNEITMEGPNGEKDYFDSPIMGIGLQSGKSQVMLPGENYFFPEDDAVLEKKMQSGGEMTPEQQTRFREYMRTSSPRDIQMPEWLSLSSGATNYARRLNNMPIEEFVNMPGDISDDVTKAFNRGISYSIDANMPRGLGRISTKGTYNPFGPNRLEDLYSGLTYSRFFPKGSVRISPEEQSFELRGKQGNIKYKRQGSDEEKISELAFNLNMRPNMTLYGKGMMGDTEVNVDPRLINLSSYREGQINPQYRVSGGLRGNAGPLNYDISGSYNPDTGYAYQGSADLSLLKNRLNLSGRVSGNEEEGLNSYSAEARARLAKGLNLTASYGKSNQDAARYNIGLTYNKAFEEGGEVEEDDDEEMVEGIADILRRVKDKKNRKQIAKKMVEDFEEEEVEYNLDDFMQAAKVMQKGGQEKRSLASALVPLIPGVSDVLDIADIVQGGVTGDVNQMKLGILGAASPNFAGRALPAILDYTTEKVVGKKAADDNQSKREGITSMSTADLQKLYLKYGPGGYDKWKKAGFPKLQMGGMSIPGINGSTIIATPSIQQVYKSRKKK